MSSISPFFPPLAPASPSRSSSAEKAPAQPVYRAGPTILKYVAEELTQQFAGPPKAVEGTRYVVVVPTLWEGRHAGPQVIAERIVRAMGGDAQRASERVRLMVGVNRRSTPLDGCPMAELAALSQSLEGAQMPMRTDVTFWLWRPRWSIDGQSHDAVGVREGDIRDALAQNPQLRPHLEAENERVATRDGIATMRTYLARRASGWQNTTGEERVLTIVTDSDTDFPPNFFDTLDALPEDVKLATGGFRYNAEMDAFSSLQNRLDMHIRSHASVDKRFVYLPEPSLVVDTSRIQSALDFGNAGLESRYLFNYLHNTVGPILSAQVCFDPRLEVITDGTRFKKQQPELRSFPALLKSLCYHPQSHARLFTWSKQVAAVANVRSELVSAIGSLFSLPHLIEDGVLRLDEVPNYLADVRAYFTEGHWLDSTHPISSVFDRSFFPRSDATLELVVEQMHAWATATLGFVNEHLTKDFSTLGLAALQNGPEAALCREAKELYERDNAVPSLEFPIESPAQRVRRALVSRIASMDRVLVASDPVDGSVGHARKRSHSGNGSASTIKRSSHPVRPIAAHGRYIESPERALRPPPLSVRDANEASTLRVVRANRRTRSAGDVSLSRLAIDFGEDLSSGQATPLPLQRLSVNEQAIEDFELQSMGDRMVVNVPNADADDILAGASTRVESILTEAEVQDMDPHDLMAAARQLTSDVIASEMGIPRVVVQPPEGESRRRLVRGSRSSQSIHRDEAYPDSDNLLSEIADLIDTGGGILRTTSLRSRSDDGSSDRSSAYAERRDALRELRAARQANMQRRGSR